MRWSTRRWSCGQSVDSDPENKGRPRGIQSVSECSGIPGFRIGGMRCRRHSVCTGRDQPQVTEAWRFSVSWRMSACGIQPQNRAGRLVVHRITQPASRMDQRRCLRLRRYVVHEGGSTLRLWQVMLAPSRGAEILAQPPRLKRQTREIIPDGRDGLPGPPCAYWSTVAVGKQPVGRTESGQGLSGRSPRERRMTTGSCD